MSKRKCLMGIKENQNFDQEAAVLNKYGDHIDGIMLDNDDTGSPK